MMKDEDRPVEENVGEAVVQAPGSAAKSPPEEDRAGAESELDATLTAEEGADDDGFVMSEQDKKLAEANDRYIRLLADFDNHRKRVQKERMDLRAAANEDLVMEVLPVLDNLDRAVTAAQDSKGGPAGGNSVLKGVELTLKMFSGILSRYGVERIDAVGARFDPNRHEAVAQVETNEKPADTVAEELMPGYIMNGRVIRASRVTVTKPSAQNKPDPAQEQETEGEESGKE